MNEVFPFDMSDIVFLLNLKIRRKNHTSWDCDCPFCGKERKLNINLKKNVFHVPLHAYFIGDTLEQSFGTQIKH